MFDSHPALKQKKDAVMVQLLLTVWTSKSLVNDVIADDKKKLRELSVVVLSK